jgi:hypothetical protein
VSSSDSLPKRIKGKPRLLPLDIDRELKSGGAKILDDISLFVAVFAEESLELTEPDSSSPSSED